MESGSVQEGVALFYHLSFVLQHLNFDRDCLTFLQLLIAKVVQTLESNDAPLSIFHQDRVVIDFLANGLFLRIVEPYR